MAFHAILTLGMYIVPTVKIKLSAFKKKQLERREEMRKRHIAKTEQAMEFCPEMYTMKQLAEHQNLAQIGDKVHDYLIFPIVNKYIDRPEVVLQRFKDMGMVKFNNYHGPEKELFDYVRRKLRVTFAKDSDNRNYMLLMQWYEKYKSCDYLMSEIRNRTILVLPLRLAQKEEVMSEVFA